MTNDTAKRLLARIKDLRKALGLSQEAFAERAGLKYKHYQAVEAGRKSNIQLFTLVKLAKACGLEPWELLNFEVQPQILWEHKVDYSSKGSPAKNAPKSPKRRSATKGA